MIAISINSLTEMPLAILFAAFVYWAAFLPFLGTFHLVAWCYRWSKREGKPERYIANLRRYIKFVGFYLITLLVFIGITHIPIVYEFLHDYSRSGSISFMLHCFFLIIVPTAFPIYYWSEIFFLSRKMNLTKKLSN